MTNRRQRRERGSVAEKPALFVKIDIDLKEKVDRVADALGITQGEAVERFLRSVEVDANGRPSWFDGELPSDAQEELPIDKSA